MRPLNEKQIYVKAYQKGDGTKVKAHYRGGRAGDDNPDSMSNEDGKIMLPDIQIDEDGQVISPKTLEGYLEEREYFPQDASTEGEVAEGANRGVESSGDSVWGNIGSVLVKGLDIASKAAAIAEEIRNSGSEAANIQIKPQMGNLIGELKQVQKASEDLQAENLKKLSGTKNKEEYANLTQTFVKQKEMNAQTRSALARIEYAAENNDYDTAASELQNYQNIQNGYLQGNVVKNDLYMYSADPKVKNVSFFKKHPYILEVATKYNNSHLVFSLLKTLQEPNQILRKVLHEYPATQKIIINGGLQYMDQFKGAHDAYELWKIAAERFEASAEYIRKNGFIVNKVSDLPVELQKYVRHKLYGQLGTYEARGLMLRPESSLSTELASCNKMINFIKENYSALSQHQIVNGSAEFNDSDNLGLALGNADILNAHIDAQGNFRAIVADTYEFNKDDPRWKVEWARNVQEHDLLENYYILCVIVIPREQLIRYFDSNSRQ